MQTDGAGGGGSPPKDGLSTTLPDQSIDDSAALPAPAAEASKASIEEESSRHCAECCAKLGESDSLSVDGYKEWRSIRKEHQPTHFDLCAKCEVAVDKVTPTTARADKFGKDWITGMERGTLCDTVKGKCNVCHADSTADGVGLCEACLGKDLSLIHI